jgi:hypothetical protein
MEEREERIEETQTVIIAGLDMRKKTVRETRESYIYTTLLRT